MPEELAIHGWWQFRAGSCIRAMYRHVHSCDECFWVLMRAVAFTVIGLLFVATEVRSRDMSCEDAKVEYSGVCALREQATNKYPLGDFSYFTKCKHMAEEAFAGCRNWKGVAADFRANKVKPEPGSSPRSSASDNVYQDCEQKRRTGYILEPNEVDYCGGLPRRD